MKADTKKRIIAVLPSIITVLLGLLIGWYLLFITDMNDSFGGMGIILSGGFTEGLKGLGTTLYIATPIMLTGMAVGFSIKTGLFNIGASGQFTVGAFTAILVGCRMTGLPPVVHCIVAIIAGTLAGGLWGMITGVLKAYFNVNEVISGIMFNYIGMLLVNMLIKMLIYDSANNKSAYVADSATISRHFLDFLIPGADINAGIFLAVGVILLIKFVMDRTVFGYELKVTGKNKFAGMYAGINDKKNIILAMAISGALAGLGGALMYLSDFGDRILVVESVLQQGFTGISVALLGMSNPVGIIIAGLFIAYITVGGNYLQLYGYTPDLVNMIIAIIVYCGALVLPVRLVLEKLIKTKEDRS